MIYGIVAVEKNQGIGFQGRMPWPHLKGDMRWFKDCTTGQIIVMGSVTWHSIGRPLQDRINVVISRQLYVDANHTYSDPEVAIKDLQDRYFKKDIYIIGGQKLYESVIHLIDTFYITEIDANYTCDKFFNMDYVKEHYPTIVDINEFDATGSTPGYKIKEYTK